MNKVYIHTEFIKLQQVLKLAGLIDQGSDVKYFLSQGKVLVNGEVATERGKKIRHGDIVELKGVGSVEVELLKRFKASESKRGEGCGRAACGG